MCDKVSCVQSFSTPWFLCARSNNHFLIFFLLETFNNLIQYQFDGEPYICIYKYYVFMLIHFVKFIKFKNMV